jgi:hypothetical protein
MEGTLAYLPLPRWLIAGKELRAFDLDIPMPPSVNNLFKTVVVTDRAGRFAGTRRVKSGEYDEWITEAGFGGNWPRGYEGHEIAILLYVDCGRMAKRRDVDNCLKPVQDLMAAMLGVDDSRVAWAASFRSEDHGIDLGRVRATIVIVE